MARLRYNGLATGAAGSLVALALSGAHNSSVTTFTFNAALTHSNGTAVPTITGSDYFMLSVLDASGNVAEIVKVTAYTTAGTTATVTRGQEGTTGVSHSSGAKVVHGPTSQDAQLGIIALTEYNPGTLSSYTTTSTTLGDVDATNLVVTFTVPPSGSVLIRLSALAGMATTSTDNTVWGLREGTTMIRQVQIADGFNNNRYLSIPIRVTGLTPGASKTYKWAWLTSVGTNTARMYAGVLGSNDIPAVMEVTALP